MAGKLEKCPYRDRCMVPCKDGSWRPRDEVPGLLCGFELAGTVEGCPKARRLRGDEDV